MMIDGIETLLRKLPPPHGKNANLAAVLGFLFGGLGLAIYFRNVIDFVLPIAIFLLLSITVGDFGMIAGAVLAAIYGYFRVTVALQVAAEQGVREAHSL